MILVVAPLLGLDRLTRWMAVTPFSLAKAACEREEHDTTLNPRTQDIELHPTAISPQHVHNYLCD